MSAATTTAPAATPAGARKGLRIGPIGLAWRPRVLTTSVVAVVAALLLVVLGVAIGSTFIAPGTVVRALLGLESGPESFIVTTLRLPPRPDRGPGRRDPGGRRSPDADLHAQPARDAGHHRRDLGRERRRRGRGRLRRGAATR
ncbi:hypothetical protein DEJ15_15060 [Curtobacterium sp. MCJR17_043]|nr:hypothetical protein [Curtobacterium sp. MCJR17_043]WIB37205.1 hypothetical protein DEJ15_15060 [Curtobacterium sp. MCJR17_043]